MQDCPPPDLADHAEDFSRRYAVDLDLAAGQVMLDLGIPPEMIGGSDPEHGIQHAAFHPHGRAGGDVTPDGRIVIDSGVMNPGLMNMPYGEEAGKLWASARLKSRIQAIAAHEHAEHTTGSHEGALDSAPDTELPVSHEARVILRSMQRSWKR